jgi:HAE1 family hydrophobic/amphiphilic exporter-1
VVDDAIVVVEATERHIEEGMKPKDAALKAMEEVAGPVVSLALILAAVFIPTIFIAGITGRLYQQFALTIVISVMLSAFNALSLSPALAAMLLKPKDKNKKRGPLGKFYDWFNRVFDKTRDGYLKVAGTLIRKSVFTVIMLATILIVALLLGARLPGAFLPVEDQGYAYVVAQLPYAASLERTDAVCKKIEDILKNTPGVKYYTTVEGFSLLSQVQATYNAFFFVTLKPWSKRTKSDEQIRRSTRTSTRAGQTARSNSLGLFAAVHSRRRHVRRFYLHLGRPLRQPGSVLSHAKLDKFMAAARKRPELAGILTTYLPSVPQVFVKVDRDKVLKLGVPLSDVYSTLQTFMGGNFVNYFNRFGRQWQVYVEAEDQYRARAENVLQFYVRNNQGQAVPLSAFTEIQHRTGPNLSCTTTNIPARKSTVRPRPVTATARRPKRSKRFSRNDAAGHRP